MKNALSLAQYVQPSGSISDPHLHSGTHCPLDGLLEVVQRKKRIEGGFEESRIPFFGVPFTAIFILSSTYHSDRLPWEDVGTQEEMINVPQIIMRFSELSLLNR